MAEVTEVGFIYQCVLCGSFAVWVVDALEPAEVSHRASARSTGQKVLQKDVHAAEEELLEDIQKRLCISKDQAESPCALLPCSACIEIFEGKLFMQWLDDRANCERPVALCPQIAVSFEADEAPPAYVRKAGKWSLAQGVGPKDLEVKLPFQLPAGQFKTLLPPVVPALRPPCWQKRSGDLEEDPIIWEERRELIERIMLLVGTASAQDSKKPKPSKSTSRAPPVGQALPFVSDMLLAAEEASVATGTAAAKSRAVRSLRGATGARYVKTPLLAAAQVIGPLVESELANLGLEA
mmetsp:Transcript_29728/g.61301  ORF Transcript_29728/g.61301 Transcript_29728/m.61301 type:complete len:294 (+) Transcript_29728:147-1028(+)